MELGELFFDENHDFSLISANLGPKMSNYRRDADGTLWEMVRRSFGDTVETLLPSQSGFNGN